MTQTDSFPLSAVLIANRGEIAVRVARVARDLGIRSIAVYSEADADAPHAHIADEAWALPGNSPKDTYLNIPALIDVALRAGADCVHPGYGFLSENSDFAREVIAAGLTWIGPDPETIDKLGDKVAARRIAQEAGAPLAPGTPDPLDSWEQARDFAEEHGLPIAIKAAFGGGGRGLKVVDNAADIESAFESAGREAREAFGRGECFVEKFLTQPRHVEAQVLADTHGNISVVGTRDCSTQRRFQKLVEEAPAPFLREEQRRAIIDGARDICAAAGYVGAGTVEYIVSQDGTVSFLEVNTRVQVEHPITEAVTGVDIVAEQFRIAAGLELSCPPEPQAHGHAFEFRINAEDAANGFVPCPGTVTTFEAPCGPGIRVDAAVRSGSQVPGFYDSLLAKLIVWGPNRAAALRRAEHALAEFRIEGVRTVLPFHRDIVTHPALVGNELGIYTDWVDKEYTPRYPQAAGGIEAAYQERVRVAIEIDGRLHSVALPAGLIGGAGPSPAGEPSSGSAGSAAGSPDGPGTAVTSPYTGSIVDFHVADGDQVSEGDKVATVEAMKMESAVTAPASGTIHLLAQAGQAIEQGAALARIED
ncbi:acetyl/propionyl/methylcrotonyl-CoA carboxylase subunit alpha [Corynebacterium uberis]|uniref:acetyl/propionyl/methylcrotonyl-CoA carboxylase subunit alpha n=1 Tax=Corynebacterium TaxID=1716 RepID=UPI001D0A1618|nr:MULTISPECIES: biotin carboxylase N-terminal domain-containing protein [Corynebacterium]MCZ9308818.1 ATP-grasp domain-containing protein [Corynebacterium sp. c6VSa_13]UDL72655.1 ATP-grasp domain-containing protein [Corynebacterium uberis]UDL76469.1 ATP-grasp domain-containing protein [Corynebacterium uberis]UDL78681.1 ATP-grasp domain-containing protein [Corynebacterium uberis]UDL80960.1 ATP-grasp domain-containing protein [Corynebacterium uberis]